MRACPSPQTTEFGACLTKLEAWSLDRRLQDLKRAHQGLINAHHSPTIVKLSAIVGGTENGNQLPLGKELVPILYDLMSSANEIKVVLAQELLSDVSTECERHPTIVVTPPTDHLLRI